MRRKYFKKKSKTNRLEKAMQFTLNQLSLLFLCIFLFISCINAIVSSSYFGGVWAYGSFCASFLMLLVTAHSWGENVKRYHDDLEI